MNKKYEALADGILERVGGKDNVGDALHCMTRLRLVLKDQSLVEDEEVKKLPGVLGTGSNAGQYQVILGNDVDKVYEVVVKKLGLEIRAAVDEMEGDAGTPGRKLNLVEKFIQLVSSIFLPVTYPIAGVGLVSGIMALCTSQGWITGSSDTYMIFQAISDGIFCFLPFAIAVSAAKYFKANGFLSIAIVGTLLYPSLSSLAGTEQGVLKLFEVLPIHLMSYSYSIIPIIVCVWLQSKLERVLKKFVPRVLEQIVTPLAVIFLMSILTLGIIGPAMTMVSNGIGAVFTYLFDNVLLAGGLLMGMFYPWMVIAGVHLAFVPIQLDMIAKTGVTMILPFMAVANTAQAGAAFAVFLKTKNQELKSVAGSAAFSALVGVTEPALYGISVRYKKPLYTATAAAAVGSVIMALGRVSASGLALSPLGGLPLYLGETFGIFLLGIIVTFALSTVLTYMFAFKKEEQG